jgi:hypothetical protein
MKLTALNPKLEGTLDAGLIRFDCPLGHGHKLRVPLGTQGTQQGWEASGTFSDSLTLSPSIHAHQGEPHKAEDPENRECGWHGFVTNGEVTSV